MSKSALRLAADALCDFQSNRCTAESLKAHFEEDFTGDLTFPGQGPALAGVVARMEQAKQGFSDPNWHIDSSAETAGVGMFRINITGVHSGPFAGLEFIEAKGAKLGPLFGFFRLVEGKSGKVGHVDLLLDTFMLMVQMNGGKPPQMST